MDFLLEHYQTLLLHPLILQQAQVKVPQRFQYLLQPMDQVDKHLLQQLLNQ